MYRKFILKMYIFLKNGPKSLRFALSSAQQCGSYSKFNLEKNRDLLKFRPKNGGTSLIYHVFEIAPWEWDDDTYLKVPKCLVKYLILKGSQIWKNWFTYQKN